MNTSQHLLKIFSFYTVIMSFTLVFPLTVSAAESNCLAEAVQWISGLNSDHEDILRNHCRENCRFASVWVKKINTVSESKKRERTCNDLVLIWSHKECIYFRDYVDDSAYYPCKSWTREMFHQCMDGNTEWFQEE